MENDDTNRSMKAGHCEPSRWTFGRLSCAFCLPRLAWVILAIGLILSLELFSFARRPHDAFLEPWLLLTLGVVLSVISAIVTELLLNRAAEVRRLARERTNKLVVLNKELQQSRAALDRHAAELRDKNLVLEEVAAVAEAATHAKSAFLANMSHELRTPLNAIIGFSDALMAHSDKHPLTPHQFDRLTKIKDSGVHLLNLINVVLDISRVECHRAAIDVADFDAGELVRETAALAIGLPRNHQNVSIDTEVDPDLPPISSDVMKVRQILIHLVTNAVKFTERGTIRISAKRDADRVLFAVEDTGIGIPPDELMKIFEKFHQVPNQLAHSLHGIGLGLAICKSFTHLLHGDLTVVSELGKGSKFTLSLPLTLGRPGRSVVCIEDDTLLARLVEDVLRDADLFGIMSNNGRAGLEKARAAIPDAVIVDVMLPGLDGWQVIEELKNDPHTSGIPVIMVGCVEDAKRAFQLGAYDFLLKPVSRQRLLATLCAAMGIDPAQSENGNAGATRQRASATAAASDTPADAAQRSNGHRPAPLVTSTCAEVPDSTVT